MSLLTPRLTEEGISMVVAALNGDSITFTRAVIGNATTAPANPTQLSDVVSPMVTASFTAITKGENFVTLAAVFDNLEVVTGAYASELGLYAMDENENEHLYAYTYVGENADYIPAHDSGRTVQIQMTIVVAIGDAEEVSAVLVDAAAYATREEFESHINNNNNPHVVTKEQVGLGLVENKYFVDNDIVVDELATAANVATGDTLRQAMSKIWYWIQKIINGTAGYVPVTGYGDILGIDSNAGITSPVWFSDRGNNQPNGIGGAMSGTDAWRIMGAGDLSVNPRGDKGTGLNSGYLEIATSDDGCEPIIVRQYSLDGNAYKSFSKIIRTMYLLDTDGNTRIPGNLWMEKPDGVTGNYDKYIGGNQSTNDFVVIRFGANSSLNPSNVNVGTAFLELAVGDDGNSTAAEPIIATQYYGSSNIHNSGLGTVGRRAYILNGAGNTVFPGSCTAKSHPTSSDLKKKDVHGSIDSKTAEALIMGLQPIFYNFKGDWKESAGFGAQDVYKLAHEIGLSDNGMYRAAKMPGSEEIAEGVEYHDSDINAHDDAEIEWNLNYTEFIPYLVKVIQDQHVHLVEQKERIDALEEKLMEVITCLQ